MKYINLVYVFLFSISLIAQTSDLGKPYSFNKKVKLTDLGYELPVIENKKILTEEKTNSSPFDKVKYYGKPFDLEIDIFQRSEKRVLDNGFNLYQFYISSETALSLNVIFSEFKLQSGTVLYLFDAERENYIGAYTSLNNNEANKLGTELLFTNKVYLEIQEPIENENKSSLKLGRIIHGYKNLNTLIDKTLNESGDCHFDVNCSEGASWQIPKDGVAMIVNSSGGFCTGSLLNNTANDEKPYLLTAFHCGSSPESWVYRFKWESPKNQAICGTGQNSVNGPEIYNINGGVTRAKYSVSDFNLIELNSKPSASWNVTYNGWDKRDVSANSGAGIHHPSGDIKKISITNSSFQTASYNGGPENHWMVNWSTGVTEGGSSGSPIFNELRRVVGQLHGGASACGSSDNSDYYGKFSESWSGGGTSSTRLSDWLDPQKSNVNFLDANVTYKLDPFISSKIIGAEKTQCTDIVKPKIVLSNGGSSLLKSVNIEMNVNGNITFLNWVGNLGLFESDTIVLPEQSLLNGKQNFEVKVSNPNTNEIDDNLTNNSVKSEFYVILDTFSVKLNLNLDCYADETSFSILNSIGDEIYREGPFVENTIPVTINRTFCLNEQCYSFVLNDGYGDGMTSSDCSNGSYYLTSQSNDTIASIKPSAANFGFKNTQNFCLGKASINENTLPEFSIFPNPANSLIEIKSKNPDTLMKIVLIDQAGRTIKVWLTNKTEEKLSISEVESGSYLLNIQTNEQNFTHKVQIVH